jgi:hypothetical protein
VKVTDVPAQTGLAEALTDTLTGSSGLTVMATTFEVAGLPLAQVAFELSTQEIASLFNGKKE